MLLLINNLRKNTPSDSFYKDASLLSRRLLPLSLAATVLIAALAGAAPGVQERLADAGHALAGVPVPPSARSRDLVLEVAKQAAEQPLHFLMSAGPIWVSRCATAVPWYGWAIMPALAYREWRQWPSKRWWDPVLDAVFLTLGLIATTWPARTRLPLVWRRRRARIATLSAMAARA
jgi:hypothetical protein